VALAAIVAVGALLVVVLAALVLSWVFSGITPAPAPPARNPFGVGVREAGGSATGIVGWILATQSGFYRQLTAALRGVGAHDGAAWTLIGLAFAYGVFHAAGPGHGKAVISAWILANERALKRGLAMAAAAALLQALVAVALVGVLAGILNFTSTRMTGVTESVELASFAAVSLVGALLLWRKSSRFALHLVPEGAGHAHAPGEPCGPACFHAAMPAPETTTSLRSAAGAIVAAGLRPCSGAIIVLVFALSLHLFPVGIAAVLAMALGTALTTGSLAALAVLAKGTALRLASGRGFVAALVVAGLEVLAAAAVLALGLGLLFGTAGALGQG
jgi:ABC-type nickel/cobalt efflux system permease component RcnA